jgi:hypothetical protein
MAALSIALSLIVHCGTLGAKASRSDSSRFRVRGALRS